jgi:hypothetical protein
MTLGPPRRGAAIALAVVCLGLLVLTVSARAQDSKPTPSAGELWKQYPLHQAPRKNSDGTAAPATPKRGAARVQATERASSPAASPSSGGPGVLWLAFALIAVAACAFVVLARRSGRSFRPRLGGLASSLSPATGLAAAPGPVPSGPAADPAPARLWQARGENPEPRPRPAPRRAAALKPPDRGRAWMAEIEWGADEDQVRFQVIAGDGEGTTATIAESGPLEWPPSGPESVQAMSRAADELEAAMLAAGWKPLPAGEAWYAKRFAWPQVAAPQPAAPAPEPMKAPAPPPPAPPPDDAVFEQGQRVRFTRMPWPKGTEELWRCELRWRAGYLHSHFEAVALEPGRRRGHPIGRSATFKWLLMGDPTPQEFQSPVDELSDALASAGWERIADGADWYSHRYVWRGDAPPGRLDAGKGSTREVRQ